MNVHGFEVREDILIALVARMKEGPFQCCQLAARAEHYGVPREIQQTGRPFKVACASRVADRLIQFHRKRGDIVRDGRGWKWRGA